MEVEAMAHASGCGNGNCSIWPMRQDSRSWSATCRRVRASGTRLSIASFPSSARTGEASPLLSYEVIIKLIAATRTTKGLTVQSFLDTNTYPLGRKVSDEDMATLRVLRD